jgi:hypothetical protein
MECPLHAIENSEACPCTGEIWYGQDRVEEGFKRLKNSGSPVQSISNNGIMKGSGTRKVLTPEKG